MAHCVYTASPSLYYNWTREDVPLDVNVSKYELLEDGSLRIHSLSASPSLYYNWTREDVPSPLDVNVSKNELLEDGSLRIHSLSAVKGSPSLY